MIFKGFLKNSEDDLNKFQRIIDSVLITIFFIYIFKVKLINFFDFLIWDWILIFAYCLIMLNNTSIYKSSRQLKLFTLLKKVLNIWFLMFSLLGIFINLMNNSFIDQKFNFLIWSFLSLFILIFNHIFVRYVLREFRKKGSNIRHSLFWGASKSAIAFRNRLEKNKWLGLKFSYWFSPNKEDYISEENNNFLPQCNGGLDELVAFLENEDCDHIFFTHSENDQISIDKLISIFGNTTLPVIYIAEWANINMDFSTNCFDDVYSINLWKSNQGTISKFLKRFYDIVLSLIIIISTSPIFLLIILSLKLFDKGSIFFYQERRGENGKIFNMIKFRTMHEDSNIKKFKAAQKNDKRITKIGRFLRKYSLDELPQFFNVLKGEMSIVGPRPHAKEQDNKFRKLIPGYMQRYSLKPGITGLAQIKGLRGGENVELFKERIKEDLKYQKEWNLLLDFKIIFKTISVFFNDDAY